MIGCLGLAALAVWCRPTASFAALPADEERRQVELLVGAYYRAVAEEDVDELVDLHFWENSFERAKIVALVEQTFAVADSDFERVRIRSIDLYPEQGIGVARLEVDYRVRSYDGADGFGGRLEAAIVVVSGPRGWRIGRVARAADLDLALAASRFRELSKQLESTVDKAPPPAPLQISSTGPTAVDGSPVAESAAPAFPAGSVWNNPEAAGLRFLAVRQKATGQCVVVAGIEGIAPGDTIYGEFEEYRSAAEALARLCIGDERRVPKN